MSTKRWAVGTPWLVAGALLGLAAAWVPACSTGPKKVAVDRSSCLVCHQPLGEDGLPHGIEDAHASVQIDCVTCHGGNAWVCDGTLSGDPANPECDGDFIYEKERAHVSPGDGPTYLKNLSSTELDAVDPAYLRFVNPGDFRVVAETCGRCHVEEAERVPRSMMSHTAGEIAVARYRAGAQPTPAITHGAVALVDPDPIAGDGCTEPRISVFEPDPAGLAGGEFTVAAAQDQYLVKACFRCHLSDFGENRFPGDFRSSGCTACHMAYANDGLSASADPRIPKDTIPHPRKHELVRSPDIDTCTHCHYRGGRIGISFQGYRESGGPGLNPAEPAVLNVGLHGHDATFYLTDENRFNDFDETPPDLHFEAGMHCVDCHTQRDIHGDGHLYSDTQCAVQTRCSDCHGTVREYAVLDPERPNLTRNDEGYVLRTKVTDRLLAVKQVKDVVTPGHRHYSVEAERAMGVGPNGFSHTDELECYTCHAGWAPSCYGCHVDVDAGREGRYQTTGLQAPGVPAGSRRWVVLNDLVLMRNTKGKLSPSLPAERFFMTVNTRDGEGRPVPTNVRNKPRTFTFEDGRTIAGFGQRPFNPHTTRRRSQFMACDRCHSVDDATSPANEVLLDITHGFGSARFPFAACDVTNAEDSCDPATDVTTYQLDRLQTRAGEPLVVVGHPFPQEARVLNLEEIARMRAVVVSDQEPIRTEIPADAGTNPRFPEAQDLR